MKHGLFIFCMLISLCFPMAFSQQATTVIKPDLKYVHFVGNLSAHSPCFLSSIFATLIAGRI